MKSGKFSTFLQIITLLVSAGSVFFFKLGSLPLLDPDEPRYGEAAREMKVSGDWINPRLNGENRWDKPVLFYWLILGAYQAWGVSEWSARFPSALFGFLSVLLVFLWCWKNGERRWGYLSSLILATSLEFAVVGRLSITDMTLSFFQSVALIVAFESWRSNSNRYLLLAYGASALAFLTKGPVGLILPALIFFVFLLMTKNLAFLKQARGVEGLIVFFAIALPWYLIEQYLYPDFFRYFFLLHNVKRFTSDVLNRTEPIYYYFAVIAAGFFPWSIFLPRALWKTLRFYWKEPLPCFLLIWGVVDLAFFSFSRSKLPTYILSLFLPMSLLVGRLWEDMLKGIRSKASKGEVFFLGVGALLVLGVGAYFWEKEFPGNSNQFLCAALPLCVLFIGICLASFWAKPSKIFSAIVLSFLCGFFLGIHFLGPMFGKARSMKGFAQEIQNFEKGRGEAVQVAFYKMFKPSLVFYLQHPVGVIKEIQDFQKAVSDSSLFFCVMRKGAYEELEEQPFFKRLILVKPIQDKVLVANHISRSPRQED
ncbi:MAG: glycosyltransferase family 39 protein [Chlamydiae bacterium]|nr:glycosyltransferase family 39 protein [Chlamydiota bacterium]MBI3267287.1 glycosyltransferase family 39 protein [Chlamydiota bacterium]